MEPSKKRVSATAIVVAVGLLIALTAGVYLVYADQSGQSSSQQASSTDSGDSDEATADDEKGGAEEGEKTEEEEEAPIPVEAVAVELGSVSSYISATANVVPENEVQILAEWEGRVAELGVEEGDRVEKGQVLAQLAREDGEIRVAKAAVRAENARIAFERAERLRAQDLLSREDIDKLSVDHQIAQQELAEAEWQVEKTLIRAPFSGRLTQRMVQLGQHVRQGEELFTVADFEPLIARIFLPERDVLGLEPGRQVLLTLKADETVTFRGRIRRIAPVVDTATGTVKVTVEAGRPPALVRPGAFVRVGVVKETRPQALLVPKDAVIRELQSAYVFIAEEGVAHKRAVELGLEEGKQIEAVSGVAAGERVIVAGQGGLKDGAPIKILDGLGTEPTQVASAG